MRDSFYIAAILTLGLTTIFYVAEVGYLKDQLARTPKIVYTGDVVCDWGTLQENQYIITIPKNKEDL